MAQLIKNLLPVPIKKRIKIKLRQIRRNITYWGLKEYCPACKCRSSRFKSFDLRPYHVEAGIIPPIIVPDTVCPWCGSHLHHRLMWSVLPSVLQKVKKKAFPSNSARILHFAPERFSRPRLNNLHGFEYISTDYTREDVMLQLDMCNLGLVGESFDLVIASHVLEHVYDDHAALRELYRILRPSGVAVLLVPLLTDHSYEKPNIVTDIDRLRFYGQRDHVRAYGIDIVERITTAGFDVEVMRARDIAELNRESYLLDVQGVLFLAKKPN